MNTISSATPNCIISVSVKNQEHSKLPFMLRFLETPKSVNKKEASASTFIRTTGGNDVLDYESD